MKLRLKERSMTIAVVATTIVIVVFAGLQYRWSKEISEATAVRLADTLQMSMVNWQLDLQRNFSEIGRALRVDSRLRADDNLAEYARRFEEWKGLARYPDLVAGVYILDGASTPARALRLNEPTQTFEPVAWPASLPSPGAFPQGATDWHFDPAARVMLRPIVSPDGGRAGSWLVLAFSDAVIRNHILQDLAHRYFQGTDGLDYEVAVIGGRSPREVLYASDPGFGSSAVDNADGTLNIFGRPLDAAGRSPLQLFHKTPPHTAATAAAISWFPLLREGSRDQDWELVVRHKRGGPLGAFLAETHRRDLSIGLAALMLLVASIAMLVVSSHRAQRLAALQMDFVTAVSHELRTPLTVISSAAENIAQGVVQGREQLTQYGTVIGNQVRQLSGLVEQILLFATHSRNPQRFTLEPLAVADVIDATLASTDGLIRAAHFSVERDIQPSLPPVMGDAVALSQCLQNLLTNALKYSRDERWIGIRARLADRGAAGREVQIAIDDRGIGISAAELPHVFEPFYRSPAVTAAQIHGTGLGLSLAKGIAEAMGGYLTVTSEPGRGSIFTLHLPCADSEIAGVSLPLDASAISHP